MTNLHLVLGWLGGPEGKSLAQALLHSLWQGALAVLLMSAGLRILPVRRANARYLVCLMGLFALPLSVCLSWSALRMPAQGMRAETHSSQDGKIAASTAGPGNLPNMSPVQPSLVNSELASTSRQATPGFNWPEMGIPSLLLCWLGGTCVCLFRSARHLAASQVLRRGEAITDPVVLEILRNLSRRLGIRNVVRLLSRRDVVSPLVVGILQPVIIVPASLITGLTIDQWQAILAHELAHIRRWDCLVNLAQLVIESLLFFNPAVWWISRQVRLEREACCDAWAVRCGCVPENYATLLVDVAERMRAGRVTATAAALAAPRGSAIQERVRRLVFPDQSSVIFPRPLATLLLLAAMGAGLGLMRMGTDAVVLAAAQILSDEERVKVLAEDAARIVPDQLQPQTEGITVRGRVKTLDGSPLPQWVFVTIFNRNQNSSSVSTGKSIEASKSAEFEISLRPGTSWICLDSEGFAAVLLGPFGNADARLIENQVVLLKPGVPANVIVEGPDRQPIAGAEVRASVQLEGGSGGRGEAGKGDERGNAILPHIDLDLPYYINVQAPGYQQFSLSNHRFRPGTPLMVTLRPALPVTGVVVDQAGRPIPGAVVHKSRERRGGNSTHDFGIPGQKLATTAEDGTFKLDQLDSAVIYDLIAAAPGYGPVQLAPIEPGATGLRFELAPEITISGVIRGPADQLEQLNKSRSAYWTFYLDRETGSQTQMKFTVEGNEAKFHIPRLARGKFALHLNGHRIERELTESIPNLEVRLEDYPSEIQRNRKVRIEFASNGVAVAPRGTLNLYVRSEGGTDQFLRKVLVNDKGVAEIDCVAPARVSFREVELVGYWAHSTNDLSEIDVPAGDEPATLTVPVLPAGAVKGRILRQDGSPAANVAVDARFEFSFPPQFDPQNPHFPRINTVNSGVNSTTNQRGEYFLSPIPLGASFWVKARDDNYMMIGEPGAVTTEAPLPVVDMKFGPAAAALIRVMNEQGQPLPGQQVRLRYEHPGINLTGAPQGTDSHGELRYAAINPDFAGQYKLMVTGRDGHQSVIVPLKLEGATEVRLPPGLVILGRVVNQNGQPVPNVEVNASALGPSGNDWGWIPSDRPTGRNGEFRFSNLSPVTYRIFVVGKEGHQEVTAVPAGEAVPMELRLSGQ